MCRLFPRRRRRLGACGALAVWLACASAATARPVPQLATAPAGAPGSGSPPTAAIAQRGSVSLAEATAMALRRYKGRVVRAETVMRGGRTVHEIRILGEDGRVRTVRIDAQTGAFL